MKLRMIVRPISTGNAGITWLDNGHLHLNSNPRPCTCMCEFQVVFPGSFSDEKT